MGAVVRQVGCAAILAFCALGASANVAAAAVRLEHACCHRASAASSPAPEVPCDGFLPLTCCHAAALPGGDRGSAPPPATFVVAREAIAPAPRAANVPRRETAPAPPIAPTRLSVVRQI